MSKFHLFDSIRLKAPVADLRKKLIPADTPGTIVEILGNDEAYLVELFGEWVKYDLKGDMIPAHYSEPNAFRETLDVVTATSDQLQLIYSLKGIAAHLAHLSTILEELPASLITEVVDFAESLLDRQSHTPVATLS